jgi:hypothetical protein
MSSIESMNPGGSVNQASAGGAAARAGTMIPAVGTKQNVTTEAGATTVAEVIGNPERQP